jgi:hypothetical protein
MVDYFSNARSKNARLGFKQSADRSDYVGFVFYILSHYCSNGPQLATHNRSGISHFALHFFSGAKKVGLCFGSITEIYSLFYSKSKTEGLLN